MQAESEADDSRQPRFSLNGSDPLTQRLDSLLEQTEASFERTMQGHRDMAHLTGLIRKTQLLADGEIGRIQAAFSEGSKEGIECAPGCSHCCYRAVHTTLPEALAIWQHVCESFSEKDREALRKRVNDYRQASQPLRPHKLHELREACPFLLNDRCSVYEYRPLSCRGLNSKDVNACMDIKQGAPEEARPQSQDLVKAAAIFRMGARLGSFFESLDPMTVDLGHAIGVLFDYPQAAAHYLKGRNSFLPSSDEGREGSPNWQDIFLRNGPAYTSEECLSMPSGNAGRADRELHWQSNQLGLQEGRYVEAAGLYRGNSAGSLMGRIDVPRIASSEEEIDESRARFLAAIHEFEGAEIDSIEAFNALSLHQTMNLTYQGRDDKDLLTEHGKLLVDRIGSRALPTLLEPLPARRKPGRLRVGYISANLNSSNGGRWAHGWLRNHGSEIERFSLFVGNRFDGVTDRFRADSHHFYWLARTVAENALFIRSLDLDVLIFTDIGLHARNTQYSCLRLARTQCTAWGHPETSGLPTIDYYLSSELMEPLDGEDQYTEKLVRLPGSGLVYDRQTSPPPKVDRAHFGLQEEGPLVVMAQALMKLVPRFDHLYAEISDRLNVPIVFLEGFSPGDSVRIKRRFQRAGVRDHWLPQLSSQDFQSLLQLADVSIDPPMWSGGNTTVQTLSAGTPVVAIPGPFMRSRHSLAFLELANAPALAARDEADYVNLVCDFDRQREAMKQLEAGALFENSAAVRALDDFLLQISGV